MNLEEQLSLIQTNIALVESGNSTEFSLPELLDQHAILLAKIANSKKSITTTEELYGISPKQLAEMNYKQALEYKIQGAKDILVALLEPHYMERNAHRINKVNKAIKHTEQLLKELE